MKKLLSNSLVAKDLLNFGTPSSLSYLSSLVVSSLSLQSSIFSRPAPDPHHSFFIHKLISHSLSSITLYVISFDLIFDCLKKRNRRARSRLHKPLNFVFRNQLGQYHLSSTELHGQ
ncbi:hypothetical protein L1887_28918 [Cichorium endivia]|nr:hypothetical protein L1887_28918 [Cichorium endivia]